MKIIKTIFKILALTLLITSVQQGNVQAMDYARRLWNNMPEARTIYRSGQELTFMGGSMLLNDLIGPDTFFHFVFRERAYRCNLRLHQALVTIIFGAAVPFTPVTEDTIRMGG